MGAAAFFQQCGEEDLEPISIRPGDSEHHRAGFLGGVNDDGRVNMADVTVLE